MTALLTEQEAAEKIGLSARTLRALRSAGKIRYVRPSPRKVYYKPEDRLAARPGGMPKGLKLISGGKSH